MTPKKRRPNGVVYYTSLGQTAAILEESIGYLKWARNNGCPGFEAGRVYRDEALPWLDSHRLAYANRYRAIKLKS